MLLSQSKAISALKPWWDFAYFYSIVALVIVEILYLVTSIPSLFATNSENEKINSTVHPLENFDHESIFPMYMLIIFVCLIMVDFAYTRMFYNAHLIQTLCHIMETISDVRQYRSLGHGLIFANTFHHASNRKSLHVLFKVYNYFRGLISLFLLIIVLYSQFNALVDSDQSQGHLMLTITSVLILLFQMGTLLYACLWSDLLIKKSLWGHLMSVYRRTLDKIDIARGRCVPSPPNQRRAERVLDALNPYMASENIKLVLDLLAYRAGVGVALRTLAHLEVDVQNNWRPFRLSSRVLSNGSLEINWKDPLAVVYLPQSLPSELRLHYGIEITYTNETSDMERIVEIVGYEETRYYQQVWSSSRPNSVSDLRSSDSIQYTEVFSGIPFGAHVDIAVWTIVDGMLISRNTKTTEQSSPPNRIPKPPRALDRRTSNQTADVNEEVSPTPSSQASPPDQIIEVKKESPSSAKSEHSRRLSSSSSSSSLSSSSSSSHCSDRNKEENFPSEIPHQRFSASIVSTQSDSSTLSLDSSSSSDSSPKLNILPSKTKSLTNLIIKQEEDGGVVMRKVKSQEETQKTNNNLSTKNNNNTYYKKNPKRKEKRDLRIHQSFTRNSEKRKSLQIGSGYMNYAFENDGDQKNPTVII